MPKNIVLLSDGTGNSSASPFKTNVWRLFQILDLRNPQEQIAFYDDGVGTSSFKLFAILGGVFGFGLKRNVIAIYSFCCRNYVPGDRIYCFGFSRGAFTIRIVAGLIASQGLVRYENNDADLARFAADAYRAYRRRFDGGMLRYLRYIGINLRNIRDAVIRAWRWLRSQRVDGPMTDVESIHFVGVWDTVDAYGGPIQEMTRAIDYWIWPMSMPDRFLNAKILRACHALSLEDERDAFTPVIWDERYVRAKIDANASALFDVDYDARDDAAAKAAEPLPQARTQLPAIDRQRISQVWFTGVHADVGGGYPENGLSFVALDWMMDRAAAYGLRYLNEQRELLIDPQIDFTDKLNDSRKGLASYYRYKPRNLKELYEAPPYKPSMSGDVRAMWLLLRKQANRQVAHLGENVPLLPTPIPIIYDAVFARIQRGTDRYAPVVIPAPDRYQTTDKNGAIAPGPHAADPAKRPEIQDDVWNWIWLRRVVYFLTAFATAFVVFIPFFVIYFPGFGLRMVGSYVNPLVSAAESFLPSFLGPWFVAFRNAPGFVLIGAIVVGIFMLFGKNLQETIHDVSRVAWHPLKNYERLTGWRATVYKLRRFAIYQAFFYVLTHWILPTAIMWWLFWWLAFGTANTLGLFCKPTGHAVDVTNVASGSTAEKPFLTSELCHPTGLKVAHDETYEISLAINDAWIDKDIPTDPNGFVLGSWGQIGGIPFKRLIWSNWFKPIVRVGSTGFEEHIPTFMQDADDPGKWTAQFVARSDGEVFIYVNDTSIFAPWLFHVFYDNNHGSAAISMRRIDKP
jgi:T6SS, Phospholipase effector Tle1-like, catalytic domain